MAADIRHTFAGSGFHSRSFEPCFVHMVLKLCWLVCLGPQLVLQVQ